jgi:hypothetical protein
MIDDSAQNGYYREIARAYLGRRGGPLLVSSKDQAVIAAWETDRVPLGVVLEGIGRAFDDLWARGRATRSISLVFCDRAVRAAFAQHRDRAAGRAKPPAAVAGRTDKRELARREVAQALAALPAAEAAMKGLLIEALGLLDRDRPDPEALERLDAAIAEALGNAATEAEKAAAAAEAGKALRGRPQAGLDETIERLVVKAVRARRRVPHVSLHYY